MGLRAGLLDRRIRLQRRSAVPDTYGQAVEKWDDIATVWARVEPIAGREPFGQQQFVAKGDVRFTIRFRNDLTPLDRIVYGEREYDVLSVLEVGRGEALQIVAETRAEPVT